MRTVSMGAILLLLIFSCNSTHELKEIQLGDHILKVEIADNDEERQLGLMHRKELDQNEGMLFVFENSKVRSFWMKDTLIPLSIAYIDERGIIVDIKNLKPLDTSPVRSSKPVKFALELNQGRFSELGVQEGDVISLPADIY